MRVLVTGGAGYIGSFMAKRLLEDGGEVIVVDSLERGHQSNVDERATFILGDLRDEAFVKRVFSDHAIDAVVHFAAYISMAESMQHPGMYFDNNIIPVTHILEQMKERNIRSFIFSSTAGVYGNPVSTPIPEDHRKKPTNPYGESKLIVEQLLKWYQMIYGINYVALRYFNASGAALDGSLGELHDPETHIIPRIITAALGGKPFTLFGTDYDTKDGTCVRDYIHVLDLVTAHVLALEKIGKDDGGFIYNVGTGHGFSNKEVIQAVEKISGIDVQVVEEKRRPGDAGTLIADPTKINRELHFSPSHSDLNTIVASAWNFHRSQRGRAT